MDWASHLGLVSFFVLQRSIDSYLVFCEACNGKWCELCLKRLPDVDSCPPKNKGKNNKGKQKLIKKTVPSMDVCKDCKAERTAKFCQRYLKASDEAKRSCEEKFPWIKV